MNADARIKDSSLRTDGLLLIDKPGGMTSHDVVVAIKKLVRPLRVGHTGTLDPLADGLLILCVGKATKIARFIETQYKLYRAVALLGIQTDTQDITGTKVEETCLEGVTEERIRETAKCFVGEIEQTPPAFSAIKIGGVRAYKRARRQENVVLKKRKVNIRRFEIRSMQLPRVELLIECSKGTYVRTLCSDLGKTLRVGGCMESLRRLAVGHFNVGNARTLADFASREDVMENLLPSSEGLSHMCSVSCTPEQAAKLSCGVSIAVAEQVELVGDKTSWVQALGPDDEVVAVGRLALDNGAIRFHPKTVLIDS